MHERPPPVTMVQPGRKPAREYSLGFCFGMEGRSVEDRANELSVEELLALAINVGSFFDDLPKRAWLKQYLVERLLHGNLSLDSAQTISGLPRNTISKAPGELSKKRAQPGYVDPFMEQQASGKFRKVHVDDKAEQRRADAEEWLRSRFVMSKSGDKSEVYRTHFSRWASFEQYEREGGCAGFPIFQAMWAKVGVTKAKHSTHDYFSCTVCQAAQQRVDNYEAEAGRLASLLLLLPEGAERRKLETEFLTAKSNASFIRVLMRCLVRVLTHLLDAGTYHHVPDAKR